ELHPHVADVVSAGRHGGKEVGHVLAGVGETSKEVTVLAELPDELLGLGVDVRRAPQYQLARADHAPELVRSDDGRSVRDLASPGVLLHEQVARSGRTAAGH